MGETAHDEAWWPVEIDPAELEQVRADPAIVVIDTIDRQRRDLARMLPAPDPVALAEPSRWLLYPWRRTVVHVLGPLGFQALRSDRNRNKITTEEQATLRQLTVGVIGLSVGHAIAHTIAMEGICGTIKLADFDEIELSNLNRIPATVFDLGLNKSVVAARRIAEIDPYIRVEISPSGLDLDTIDEFMASVDIVVEECDSFDVKLAVREAARRHSIPVVMEASDRGLIDVERYDLEPDRPIWHNLLGDTRAADVSGLSTHDKIPYVLRTFEPEQLSTAMAASMVEVDETISTWPQLAADISLGAAIVTAVVRKLGLGEPVLSGRSRVDFDAVLRTLSDPAPPAELLSAGAAVVDPEPAPQDPVGAIVHAARLAPSGGNTQPWKFAVGDSRLDIWLDPGQTSTLDLQFRGSYVAIGAALFNARVAAARHGRLGQVEIHSADYRESPVATLHFGDDAPIELAELYPWTVRRATNRHLTKPAPLADGVVSTVLQAARAEGAGADIVTDRDLLHRLAELLGESDRMRYLTGQLHQEMMRELRWPATDSLDWGLDVRTLELDSSDLAKLRVARRGDVMSRLADQDLGRALGESTRDRIQDTSGLVVVTVDQTDSASYVRAGQAVERVWVEAERLGLAVQPMSPVFIYAVDDSDYRELSPRFADRLQGLRADFAEITGIGARQIALVMRIGYAPEITARSRRLPVDSTVRAI